MSETQNNTTIELYRTPREVIKINNTVCFGVLDGKHFLIKRATERNIETYIYWHKNKNITTTQLLHGVRAEKLIQMVLNRIQNTPENQEIISDLNIMYEKAVRHTQYFSSSFTKAGEYAQNEIKNKQQRELNQFMDKQAAHAEQNALKKAQKQADKEIRKAQKEAEKQKRQEEAQKRIQQQRNEKLLKEELRLYEKMLSTQEDKEPVIALKEDDTTLFLGKMDNSWYRIKLSKESNSFYQITDQHRQIIPIEMFSNILTAIDEKLNKNGTFDHELENIALSYGQFMRENKEEKTPSTLNERVAISKNILIQKNILNQQNSL